MPKRRLTLLHTSDLHLGSDVYPAEALRGLQRVVNAARSQGVDAVLVAGDLFDSSRVPEETVGRVIQGLRELARPVYFVPGNHDDLLTGANGASRQALSLPPNVHLFQEAAGETFISSALGLSVWGRPVYDHSPSFRPLEGLPTRPSDGWFVVVAHGLVMDGQGVPDRSSPITPRELSQADCDYIALGHVHVFRDVTREGPPAFYSGAPSGIQPKTVSLVTLDPTDGVTVEPLTLA